MESAPQADGTSRLSLAVGLVIDAAVDPSIKLRKSGDDCGSRSSGTATKGERMSQRAALYARVSTARQEQEQTVASQIEALERAATAMGAHGARGATVHR